MGAGQKLPQAVAVTVDRQSALTCVHRGGRSSELEGDLGGLKFAIANAQKDLRYYTHLAETLPVPSFVAEAAHQSFVQAANLGLGDRFIASLFEAQERTANVRIVDNAGRQP